MTHTDETFAAARRRMALRLEAAGFDEAAVEARLMVEHVTGLSGAAAIASDRQTLTDVEAGALAAMLVRRLGHEPLQHITGRTGFYGLEILCDARALIPRHDSECVVEAALERLPEGQAAVVADLGTGSGCLLAALLANRPLARGTGVEASPAAAELARKNLDALGLAGRAEVFEGSWADWTGWGAVDLILSNPPYIASAEIETLDREVRLHDPRAALDGGADGLEAYREIAALGAARMKPGAWMVLETGHDQRGAVTGLLVAHGFTDLAAGQDLGGNDRWAAGRRPA